MVLGSRSYFFQSKLAAGAEPNFGVIFRWNYHFKTREETLMLAWFIFFYLSSLAFQQHK